MATHMWRLAVAIIVLSLNARPGLCQEDEAVVHLDSGTLKGRVSYTKGGDRPVYGFQGIPFAAPPVGELRFKPPQTTIPWEGVRDATQPGAACPQDLPSFVQFNAMLGLETPAISASEDCLFLEVYTPSLTARRPVMVWIHGGGLTTGFGSGTNGTALAAMEDVVLVAINYRLGILGFFSTGDENAPGNYGFLDQVAALQWVKDNIQKFGGDPNQVTIFGQSAGGFSVSLHLLSPVSEGLFKRGICQSGAALIIPTQKTKQKQLGQLKDVATIYGCSGSDGKTLLECLRQKTMEEIIELPKSGSVMLEFYPIIDNNVIPGSSLDLLAAGKVNEVEVMAGVSTHEGHLLTPFLVPSLSAEKYTYEEIKSQLEMYLIMVARPVSLTNTMAAIENVYMDTDDKKVPGDKLFQAVVGIIGDQMNAIPTYHMAELAAENLNTYFYEFSRPDFESSRPAWVDTDHGDDLFFIFGSPYMEDMAVNYKYTKEEMKLSQIMMKYWTNFAKYGDPNGAGMANWPRFTSEEKKYLLMSTEPKVKANYKPELKKLWIDLMNEGNTPAAKDEL